MTTRPGPGDLGPAQRPDGGQVAILLTRVVALAGERQDGPEETLAVLRRDREGGPAHEFFLSNVPLDLAGAEFYAAAEVCRREDDCLRRGESEVGLADHEVRTWAGWHHHQTLALIALWLKSQPSATAV